jgi:hypothetical protein
MKNVRYTIYIFILVLTVSSATFGKTGTISTTKAGTISTTKTGTISTTVSGTTRTGTISTTRTGIIPTTQTSVSAGVQRFPLYELLVAAFRLW